MATTDAPAPAAQVTHAEKDAPTMREEWRSLVTLKYGDGGVSTHYHDSAADAEHFKAWRSGLHGEHDGMVWPPVEIVTEHRYVTEWARFIPPGSVRPVEAGWTPVSIETLRRTAALMRERAEAAVPGPWPVSCENHLALPMAQLPFAQPRDRVTKSGVRYRVTGPPANYELAGPNDETTYYIASWHPAVALAVADWLTLVARGWSDDPGCDLGGGMDGPPCGECFKCAYYENQHHALAVARAYLADPHARSDRDRAEEAGR